MAKKKAAKRKKATTQRKVPKQKKAAAKKKPAKSSKAKPPKVPRDKQRAKPDNPLTKGRAGRRSKHAHAVRKRRTLIGRLLVRGWSRGAIAERLGVSVDTVKKDAREIAQEWRDRYAADYEDHLERIAAHVEEACRQAWRGWARSLQDDVTQEESTGGGQGGDQNTVKTKRRGQAGDPNFLNTVLRAQKQLADVLKTLRRPDADDGPVADGFTPLLVTVTTRREVDQVITLPEFRHQFTGWEPQQAGDAGEVIDGLIEGDTLDE